MTSAAPSSADGLYLIVSDVSAAHNELVAWGADVSGVAHPEAAAAHAEHEGRTGETDPNWPEWYAAYMAAEQAGTELPS